MAEKELNLTKLDGQNFQMWKFSLNFLLEAQELCEFVDGTTVEPDKTTKIADWKKWKKNSSRTAVLLLSSVEQSLHVNLINCETPKEIWDKIHSLYGDTSQDAKQTAWQQFYEYKIKEGVQVSTQVEQFETICKKLENAGEKLTESAVISKLLSSLPPRFSTFCMAWECTPSADRTKQNLVARILREEKRLCDTEESVSQAAFQVNALKINEKSTKPADRKKEN